MLFLLIIFVKKITISKRKMKITGVKTYQLRYEYCADCSFSDAMGTNPARQALLVKIETNTDLYGIGEAWSYGSPTNIQSAIIKQQLEPILVNQDPTNIEQLYQTMYWRTIAHGRRGLIEGAISGVDIALWDLFGKICNMPVHKLLGGQTNKVSSYASGGFYFHSKEYNLASEIKNWVKLGYKTFKIKIGRVHHVDGNPCKYSADQTGSVTLSEDIERIALLREIVGPNNIIIVDANSAWTPEIFNLVIGKLKAIGLNCIEEPYPFENIEGYEKLHEVFPEVAIMGFEGEQNIFNFAKITESHYLDILEPDIGWCGGFTATKKIAAEAEAHYKRVSMHSFGSAVHFAASLQMAAAIPNAYSVEDEVNFNPLRTDLLKKPFVKDKEMNYLLPEDKPGLGIELDWNKVKKYEMKG